MESKSSGTLQGFVGGILTTVSIAIAFTQSPLYTWNRPVLSFYEHRRNSGQQDDGTWRSHATVTIENKANYPAKNVNVLLSNYDHSAGEIVVYESPHTVGDKTEFTTLVTIECIPAKSTVTLAATSNFKEDNPFTFHWSAPMVERLASEYGDVKKDFSKSSNDIPMKNVDWRKIIGTRLGFAL